MGECRDNRVNVLPRVRAAPRRRGFNVTPPQPRPNQGSLERLRMLVVQLDQSLDFPTGTGPASDQASRNSCVSSPP